MRQTTASTGRRLRFVAPLATALIALTTLAACGGSGSDSTASSGPTDITISMASYSMTTAPVLTALALNTFTDHDLKVKDVPAAGSSSNGVAALLSGSVDFAVLGADSAVAAIQQGAPITIVGATAFGTQRMVLSAKTAAKLAPVTPTSPVADRIKAVRGLTIATSPAGSTLNGSLHGLLKENGMDPEKDVKIVPSDPTAIVAGLKSGLYDAGWYSVGTMENNLTDKSGVLWIDVTNGDIPEFQHGYAGFVVASKKTVAQKPKVVAALMASLADAGKVITGDEPKARDAVQKKYFPSLDATTYGLTWDAARPAFATDPTIPKKTFDGHLALQSKLYGTTYDKVTYADAVRSGKK